jgi:hypothetical protein
LTRIEIPIRVILCKSVAKLTWSNEAVFWKWCCRSYW